MFKVYADNNFLEQGNVSYDKLNKGLNKYLDRFNSLIKDREQQLQAIGQRKYDTNNRLRMISDLNTYHREWLEQFSIEATNLINQLGLTEHLKYAYINIIERMVASKVFARQITGTEFDYTITGVKIKGASSKVSGLTDLLIMLAYHRYNYKATCNIIDTITKKVYNLECSIETLYGIDMSVVTELYIRSI